MHAVDESVPERRLRMGKVGRLIDRLAADHWRVLDGVHTGLHTIDHVVVGPPGIFTVRTNARRGVERAIETDRFWLSHASALGRWVEHAIAAPVQPLLVFSHALVVPSVSWQLGAWVMSARGLKRHLSACERQLSAQEVDATFERLVDALSAHVRPNSCASASAMSTPRAMLA